MRTSQAAGSILHLRAPAVVAAAVAAVLALSPAAGATSDTVAFRDIRGDANAVNGQEEGGGDGVATGSASIAAVDLRRVALTPVRADGRVTAIKVALTMTAPPARGYAYHLSARKGGCSVIADHYIFRSGEAKTQLRQSCGAGITATALAPATVVGRTITITIPKAAYVDRHTALTRPYAYTRGNVGRAPVFPFPVTPVQFDSIASGASFAF